MAEYNYQHSLELLKSIEKIAREQKFTDLFLINGYDFFEAYRYRIFTDIKGWKGPGSGQKTSPASVLLIEVRVFLLNLISLVVTALGVLQLVIFRKKVLVYSPDKLSDAKKHHDFRLDEVYQFLEKKKIPYGEILHTNIGKTFLVNLLHRGRLPVYTQSLDFLYKILSSFGLLPACDLASAEALSLDTIEEKDHDLARLVFRKYLYEVEISKFKIKILKWIFKTAGISLILSVDDPRGYSEIMLAAKTSGVRSAAFQHGHFTKYHTGWLSAYEEPHMSVSPDFMYVWSSYWKNELHALSGIFPQDLVKIAVPEKHTRTSSLASLAPHAPQKTADSTTTILIPYETDAPKTEVKEYIKALLECPGVRIIFKIRNDMPENIQCEQYGLVRGEKVEINGSLNEAAAKAHMVLGVYSTFLYDMIAFEIPVGLLKTSMDYGEGMIRNEVADLITKENICTQIENLKNLPSSVRAERKTKVYPEKSPTIADALALLLLP